MVRESIEEGELSTPLVAKEERHQVYASGDHLGCANSSGCDDGGESQNGSPRSATSVIVLSTLVAVSGSYVFGIAYSVFGSILTIGAMIGAIVSGQIAGYIGRRGGRQWAFQRYSARQGG